MCREGWYLAPVDVNYRGLTTGFTPITISAMLACAPCSTSSPASCERPLSPCAPIEAPTHARIRFACSVATAERILLWRRPWPTPPCKAKFGGTHVDGDRVATEHLRDLRQEITPPPRPLQTRVLFRQPTRHWEKRQPERAGRPSHRARGASQRRGNFLRRISRLPHRPQRSLVGLQSMGLWAQLGVPQCAASSL